MTPQRYQRLGDVRPEREDLQQVPLDDAGHQARVGGRVGHQAVNRGVLDLAEESPDLAVEVGDKRLGGRAAGGAVGRGGVAGHETHS